MGNGSSNKKKEKNIDQTLQDLQKNQSRSQKYDPFADVEIQRLREKFRLLSDNKPTLTLNGFKQLLELKTHFFRERIFQLVEAEMTKRNKTDIDFDYFIKVLTPFHPLTSIDSKYKLLFDIYDINADNLISQDDIKATMKIIYSIQISKDKKDNQNQEENYRKRNAELEEVKEAFMANQDYLDSLAKDIMNDFDKDRSGELDFGEFKELVDNLDLQFRLNINF
ncbi:EF hand protein (macronuclear) [Tetrahymena thermophila SB210]|uniref:EF hand protein n=1 Tax=Tetrahymena thermophila (strain SB210) TaxID=312017 RepID=Q22DM3_TETTS|nr:EF hand protein [Tetrahymena thermophila SB210]EAR83431.1 EF hand protein [Tetrahymena thermophila SB210]|eukprot:XP_001031094.1 EF hand protein [Tetrahymena thermophila SB210]